jgi:O-antigen ligase
MGLKESINSMANIVFVLAALIWGDWRYLQRKMSQLWPLWALSAWLFLYAIGLIYSADTADAGRRLMIKSMLFIWPPSLVLVFPYFKQLHVKRILVSAPVFFALLCLIRALSRYFGDGDFSGDVAVFMYYRLSAWIMHPNYFMLFLGAGIVVQWWERLHKRILFTRYVDLILWWFLLLFTGALLQARTGFIILVLLLVLAGVWYVRKQWSAYWSSALIYPLVIVLGVILLPPEFGRRYFINTSTEFVPDKENDTSFSGRLIIWSHCLSCWEESFWFGHGPGDGVWRLHQIYEEEGFSAGVNDKYNCHNQYLETAIASGVLGLLVIALLPALLLAFWRRNPRALPLLIFVMFVYGSMFFESVLERHKGVMILAVVVSALSIMALDSKQEEGAS